MTDHNSHSTRDPLDIARSQLDYAALAAGAPAVKDVLFKAQTMAPVSSSQIWKKAAKGAAAAAVLALLVFAPIIPHNISYSLLRVEFERPFAPVRAQQMIDAAVRALPSEVLVGVEQRQSRSNQAVAPRVVLRLSQAGTSGSRLRRTAENALLVVANEAHPLYYPAEEYHQISRNNLIQEVAGWLAPDTLPTYELKGEYGKQANRLLKLEPLLQTELGARLSIDGYELSGFRFISRADELPTGYDFTIPSWPLPAALAVEGFASELDSEQEMLKTKATEFMSDFNLMPDLAPGAEPRTQWPAVVVSVQDTSGRFNPQLTARLQAAISQPGLRQASEVSYEPYYAVENALERVLAWAEYKLQSSRSMRADGSTGWQVTVVIDGERSKTLRVFEEQEAAEANNELY